MPEGYELGRDYEVIVFDDASADGTNELLNEYAQRVTVLSGNGKGSYADNNNAMAKQATGDWLCMLNNDTILEPGWLSPMLKLAQEHPEAGVIGNIHVFEDRKIVNHAGVVFNEQRIPRNLYDGLAISTPGVQQDRQVQSVMAACWITPRSLFERLNGFDTQYRTGCEDVDYCQRVLQNERSVWVAGNSVIVHHGGSTPGRYKFDSINERRFLRQWKDKITPDWKTIPQRDGVQWPNRSASYKAVRSVWRSPLTKYTLAPVMRTKAGMRVRQQVLRSLVDRSGSNPDTSKGYPTDMDNDFLVSHGRCPACGNDTTFRSKQEWLRDHFFCESCGSIPRERALMRVIETYYPDWRNLRIHESSPGNRGTSIRLRDECKHYTATQYDTEVPFGKMHPHGHYQSENLEDQTFDDESFDLVISQDVMEHVFDPDAAYREIARTLRPSGAHIFTTPLVNKQNPTECCAVLNDDGTVKHLREPEYHGNPIDSSGSLVTFRWGFDITARIQEACGLNSTLIHIDDLAAGIQAEYIEVCLTQKASQALTSTNPKNPETSSIQGRRRFLVNLQNQRLSNTESPCILEPGRLRPGCKDLNFDLPRPGIAPGNLHDGSTSWSDPSPRYPIAGLSAYLDEHPRSDELVELFDPGFYLKANKDLAKAGITKDDAFEHFCNDGYRQRRIFSKTLRDVLDISFYNNKYPELGLADDAQARTHYAYFGRYEDRVPNLITEQHMLAPAHLYQMGKVGSIAIRDAILDASGIDCPHMHWVDHYHDQHPKLGIHYSRILNRAHGEPVRVIAGVRDPFERIISGHFQEAESLNMNRIIKDSEQAMNKLTDRFTNDACVICNWFQHNFFCNLNVHEHPFDPERGYTVIKHRNMHLFLYRQDSIHKLDKPIADFMGMPNLKIQQKNTGDKKFYADVYKDISNSFKVPEDVANALASSALSKHFFSQAERESMLERWTDHPVFNESSS